MADGDITLKVNLNTQDVISKSMQLKTTVKGIFDSVDTSKMDSGTQKMLANMDKLVNKAEDYMAKIRNMENTKVDNPWIEETGKQMEAVEAKLSDLYSKMHEVSDGMGGVKLVHTEEEQAEIAKLEQELEQLGSRYAYLSENASKVSLADLHPEKVREYESALNQTNNELTIAVTKFNEAQSASAGVNSSMTQVAVNANSASSSAREFGENASSSATTANSSYKKVASTLRGTVSSALNKVKSSVKNAFSVSTLTSFIKKIALVTIGVTSLTAIFNKLKTAISEGLDNLVQYQSETNETNQAMTELTSSLNYLKNAWASAFAPILNYVTPVLTLLMDKVSDVANMIARLFGTLTGATQVLQAVKTDAEDYASTLDGVSSSASSASSSQSKLNDKLASFDDLNVLGKDSDTSGSGGGGVSSSGTDVSDMFEYVDLDTGEFQWLLDFFEDLKKKVEDSGLLTAINNLWEALQNFKDSAFVTTMMRILEIIGDSVFTSTLSILTNLFNLMADILNGDLNSGLQDFKSLIADLTFDPLIMLAKVFDEIFGTDVAGWLEDTKQAVEDFDLTQLKGYDDLTDALEDIQVACDNLKVAVQDFWGYLEETGILDTLTQFITWFVGLNFDLLLQGIATALDLLASSIQLIADIFSGDWFGVVDEFVDIWTTINLDPISTLASILDSIVGTDIAGWIDGIQESIDALKFADFVEAMESGWARIRSAFWLGVGVVSAVLGLTDEKMNDFKHKVVVVFTAIKSFIEVTWRLIKSAVITAVTTMIDKVEGVFDSLQPYLEPVINSLIMIMNRIISGIESMVNGISEALQDISIDIPEWVPEWGGKSVKFNMGTVSLPRIPYLAEGAVIPPNKEFMAVLGDQSHGTNIEAPLDTIKQAVAEELSEQLNVLQEGFASVVQAINNKDLAIGDKAIGQANARYTAQQNKIRGVNW